MITLLDVLDEAFEGTSFDKARAGAMYRYQIDFLNRTADHLEFFGSNLIGVHVVRFRVADTLKFYKDVAGVDFVHLERALKKVTTIVQEFKITSDALNLTLMYFIHRFLNSPKLSEKDRERAAYDTALVFFYRCIAIRQSEYFPFPADPKIAQAAYAELSKKYLIKSEGSWKAVMEYRAKDLISKKGLHYQPLMLFTDDMAVAYAIGDSENRVRDLYKNYCKVYYQTYQEGNRIGSASSTMIDLEGVEMLREKIKSTEQYIGYLRTAIVDPGSFVKAELVSVIIDINTNTSTRMLTSTLTWLSEHYNDPKVHARIDEFLSRVIVHSFHLLSEVGQHKSKDYATLLITLKNLYLSTRSSDADLLRIRELGEKLIKEANGKVNPSLSMATRTAVILYLTLRAIVTQAK